MSHLPTSSLHGAQSSSESVADEKDGSTDSSYLLADVKILGNAAHGIRIETGVEVHRDLDEEDDGEDGPFLTGGKEKPSPSQQSSSMISILS